VSISLRPEHLKRYKDLARLLFKYGRGDLVKNAGLAELLPEDAGPQDAAAPAAKDLADDLEKLGPTFIKLGQLLSTRPDIVPPAYAQALTRLQDHVEPFPFAEVEKILEEELGVRPSHAFGSIDPKPLAAASIAQVHHATLRDGREVALKIQRPGIRERVLTDLDALGHAASFLERHTAFGQRFGIVELFEEFRKSLLRELDFRQEAAHLTALRANLADIPEIVVPRPVADFSTARVLTMEFIPGTKVTVLSPLARMEMDGGRLADALFRAYLKQMLRDGLFHADPHPGNVFLVGDKIALIDLGMVARVSPGLQDRLLQLLLAVSDNRAEDAAETLFRLGRCLEDADENGFRRGVADIISQHQDVTAMHRPQVGRAVLMLLKVAGEHGVRLPPELALIGKTLLNLDEIGRRLAPDFDPNEAIRRHAAEITKEQMKRDLSIGSIFSSAVELKNFVTQLPGRVNRILDRVADNEFKVRVDSIDEVRLMEGLQKVANRIALGLVLAALIVGAALMIDVPTDFTLLGYPGIAILLFLGAAAGGVALVVAILMSDIKAKRRPQQR
jgi:ubiquinone biosynthesis protein